MSNAHALLGRLAGVDALAAPLGGVVAAEEAVVALGPLDAVVAPEALGAVVTCEEECELELLQAATTDAAMTARLDNQTFEGKQLGRIAIVLSRSPAIPPISISLRVSVSTGSQSSN